MCSHIHYYPAHRVPRPPRHSPRCRCGACLPRVSSRGRRRWGSSHQEGAAAGGRRGERPARGREGEGGGGEEASEREGGRGGRLEPTSILVLPRLTKTV